MESKIVGTYLLSQKIGIYYKHKEWAEKVFNEMISTIPKAAISKAVKGRYDLFCGLYDGSVIKCVPVCNRACVLRFDKVIIEPGIDKKVCDTLIMPALVTAPRGYVIEMNEENGPIVKDIRCYYAEQKEKEEC